MNTPGIRRLRGFSHLQAEACGKGMITHRRVYGVRKPCLRCGSGVECKEICAHSRRLQPAVGGNNNTQLNHNDPLAAGCGGNLHGPYEGGSRTAPADRPCHARWAVREPPLRSFVIY